MRLMFAAGLLFMLALLTHRALAAEAVWQTRELPADKSRYGHHYMVYLPPGYSADSDRQWPLIVFLHGRGEWGDDIRLVRRHGPLHFLAAGNTLDAIVVAPQSPTEQYWHPLFIDAVMQDVVSRFRIDPSRTYLTGLSMGGIGSWQMAMAFPQRFAALAPVAGCLMNDIAVSRSDHDLPDQDSYTPWLHALRGLPTWVFHGDRDSIVDTELGQRSAALLRAAGGDVKETIYPMTDHDSWTPTYMDSPAFYTWLLSRRRSDVVWNPQRPALDLARYVGRYVGADGDTRAEVREDAGRLVLRWVREGQEEELLPVSAAEFVGTALVRFDGGPEGHMRSVSFVGMGEAVWQGRP